MTAALLDRALELRRRHLPAERELALLTGGLLLAAIYIARRVIQAEPLHLLPPLAAIVGLAIAFFGGTGLCFPLYFATTLGAEIMVPGLPFSLNRAMAALLLLAAVIDLFRQRLRTVPSLALAMLALFHLYFIPAAFALKPKWAGYPVQAIYYLVPIGVLCTMYWREARQRTLVAAITAITMAVLVLPGLVEYALRVNVVMWRLGRYDGRIDGFSQNSIVFGQAIIWAVPFALLLFLESRRPAARMAWLAAALAMMFCSVITLNRQTPIILAVQLAVFLVLIRHRLRAAMICAALLGALAATPWIAGKVGERFATANSVIMDASLGYRHDKILVAMEMWKDHFWLGVGHDHFRFHWRDYIPKGRLVLLWDGVGNQWIDSGYIQIMTEYGAIGAGLFVLLMAASALLWMHAYIRSRALQATWHTNMLAVVAACVAHFLVANLISDAFMTPRTLFALALLTACATAVDAEHRRLRAEAPP